MSKPLEHRLLRALTVPLLASFLLACNVTVHNHGGSTTPKGGTADDGDGSTEGKEDKPKTNRPKDDKPKTDKPKDDKPKTDKPKDDKPKADKPKEDKPKTDKPKTDKPVEKPVDKPKDDKPVEKPVDKPKPDTSSPSAPADPSLPPGVSRLSIPVRAPFEQIIEHIDALLPKTQSQDYKRVTKDGDSLVLDVKYKAWRDPIEARFSGRTLTVVVPVRYAATIRGKVKSPFGNDYFPLADGQTWGTSSSPQRMRIPIELELNISDDWKVTTKSRVGKIEHGSAPKGNFCAKVGIDVCTPKSNVAGDVRANIEKFLLPQIIRELERADRAVAKSFDLRTHARQLWAGLQQPLQLQKKGAKECATSPVATCSEDAWLVLAPTRVGLSELAIVDGDLGVDVALEGKLSIATGKKPKVKVESLPNAAPLPGATSFQLRTHLEVPQKLLADEVRSAIKANLKDRELEIREVTLSGKSEGKLTLTIKTKGALSGTLKAQGRVVLDQKKGEVRLEKVALDDETKKLLDQELKALDQKALIEKIENAARVSLTQSSKILRRGVGSALDGALPGELEIKGSLGDVSFVDLSVEDEVIRIQVNVQGSLGLEYKL